MRGRPTFLLITALWLFGSGVHGQQDTQVTSDPQAFSGEALVALPTDRWPTNGGNIYNQRYSPLNEINRETVANLRAVWRVHLEGSGVGQKYSGEAQPIVNDGKIYVVTGADDVFAIGVNSGQILWRYSANLDPNISPICCGWTSRGVALGDGNVYVGQLDGQLIALDQLTGEPVWSVQAARWQDGYSITSAPLYYDGLVVTGFAGAEYGIRGRVSAFHAADGSPAWVFHTVPGPGDVGHDTWPQDNEVWMHGGASVWQTPAVDPGLGLLYFSTGNPGPDFFREQRPGDNLYTCSVVALDADTGEIRWHFQFTPDDPYDYDSVQIPVLADIERNNTEFKVMLWANRNGFYYVLDRMTGRFLQGVPFVNVNWAEGLDDSGRPVETPQPPGAPTYPGIQGGTNWYSPSYSPQTELFYIPAWENNATVFGGEPAEYVPGQSFTGRGVDGPYPFEPVPDALTTPGLTRGPINRWTEVAGTGAVLALDALTGEQQWKFEMTDVISSGILTTASDLLFAGARSGYFQAINASTGALLWKASLGSQIVNGPMTYEVEGKQYVAVISGHALSTFALPD